MAARNTLEAAQYLGVSESYLNQLRVRGDGPTFYKYGRRVSYETNDLDLWKESRRRRSTSEYKKEAA
ncbi:hypothetical protein OPKNFCMD_4032 [Methylobacterium crusticola]|uniref:Helix-turn-helix domain-containing protein n=1 Tax=Methylobacterium crusticola TaxID=1697972 RepID=A0ABQ4R0S7_9HYPH|nr:helix-turn-helix domain-containing protein [Methylobacterium crusticola]GJD51278.1 hypothetical protein OPKNFCMD_4032 [Methylobacterium crusticola]